MLRGGKSSIYDFNSWSAAPKALKMEKSKLLLKREKKKLEGKKQNLREILKIFF